ncbi:dead deah box helicase domain-containing protein [Cystoisospora suis]|uniref:ATP-dependent RNA helicase n=1 Tax=Cystoisospora suis TaxID=483139 RepID=A0A2C6KJ56_9APIC|nr:dead deah box helicase domain-containing protein [Cystoisospora suis]
MATSPGPPRRPVNRHSPGQPKKKTSISGAYGASNLPSTCPKKLALDGGVCASAKGNKRTEFARKRAVSTNAKLRQREQQEIRELEDRICVEMPLPGLCWAPPIVSARSGATAFNAAQGNPSENSEGRESLGHRSQTKTNSATGAEWEMPKQRNEGGVGGDGSAYTSADGGHETQRTEQAGIPVLSKFYFSDLPLSGYTRRGLQEAGFHRLSSVQFRAIPHALRGADILGEAKTGSGKTLCFVVPVLECLYRHRVSNVDGLSALVLVPTRELAVQIFDVFKVVGRHHEFSAGCLIGGKSVVAEANCVNLLNIVVGTPGRVLQHMEESPLWEASGLKVLVVDEADRLVDMGFVETTRLIVQRLPSNRTTLLFSATLKSAVKRLGAFVTSMLPEGLSLVGPAVPDIGRQDAETISVATGMPATPLTLKQSFMVVPPQHKLSALFSFLRAHNSKKILVFVSSCKQARFLHETFRILKPGLRLMYLHGRQRQQKRLEVFEAFVRRPGACCLVSTDLASRGIDFTHAIAVVQKKKKQTHDRQQPSGNASFPGGLQTKLGEKENRPGNTRWPGQGAEQTGESTSVDFVVQMDCPDSVETYIHRVGRTARMQRKGRALLMLLPSEQAFISRLKDKKIELEQLFLNPSFALKIENKLQALLAERTELKGLAQRALASYLRCIALMPDKDVFCLPTDVRSLTLLSNGYGLSLPPTVKILGDTESEGGEVMHHGREKRGNAVMRKRDDAITRETVRDVCVHGGAVAVTEMKQKKNLTKLERLKIRGRTLLSAMALLCMSPGPVVISVSKEKIRQKKAEKEVKRREAEATTLGQRGGGVTADSGESPKSSFSVKVTSVDVRAHDYSAHRDQDEVSARGADEGDREERCEREETDGSRGGDQADFFSLKDAGSRGQDNEDGQGGSKTRNILLHEQLLRKPIYQRERLRFRADGTAKVKGLAAASLHQGHVFFEEEEDEKEEISDAQEESDQASAASSAHVMGAVSLEKMILAGGASGEKEEVEDEAKLRPAEPGKRQAYLERVRKKVEAAQQADKDRNRQRVHERHALKRQRERAIRKADAAERGNRGGAEIVSDSVEQADSLSLSSQDEKDAFGARRFAREISWKGHCSSSVPNVQGLAEKDSPENDEHPVSKVVCDKSRGKRTSEKIGREGRAAHRRKVEVHQESARSRASGDDSPIVVGSRHLPAVHGEDLEKMALKVLQG